MLRPSEAPCECSSSRISSWAALALVHAAEKIGVEVVGPAPNVEDALRLIEEQTIDAALLDINLGGDETIEPVASKLEDIGCPFVFVTGYSSPKVIDPRFQSHRIIPKLFDEVFLRNIMRTEFGL